jgi:hypothetical protein
MFCCKCGARNPNEANFCHRCGNSLYVPEAGSLDQSTRNRAPQQVGPVQSEEQGWLINELLPIDQKLHECHSCGRKGHLHSWDFGLGKKLSTKRAWGETALSVAVSAVTIPLIGAGGLRLPGKKTSYRVLQLRLILCDSCWEGQTKYSLHPWWQAATRLGYTEFFDAEGLKKLEPA